MSTSPRSYLNSMLSDEDAEPMPLPLSLLEVITNGFSYNMEIGRGGFALVYRGILQNGTVAVKRLMSTGHTSDKDFLQEIDCLVKAKHQNIVRFLGYCDDTKGNVDKYEGKAVMAKSKERLLCFEYLPNGGLDRYITDPTCGLEWEDRFDIIKGICEGLHHLHQKNILHLDLKPANILLNENMQPKITDFGISRSFQEGQTRTMATQMKGTPGYMAPEHLRNLITKKYDFYSLGVIIMEVVTGERTCQGVETVLKSWNDRLTKPRRHGEREQIRVCIETGIQCREFDLANRPVHMKHIIDKLAQTEKPEYSHPLKHRFYPEHSESIPCSLHLTNKTDEHVPFRLMCGVSDSLSCYSGNPLFGVVPPRSTCTLIMTKIEKELAERKNIDLVLQSIISGHPNIMLSDQFECNEFFKEAKVLGHAVYEVAISTPRQGETTSELAVRRTIIRKPVFPDYGAPLYTLDAHPTEPWIVMGFVGGNIHVWNHESKTTMNLFNISEDVSSIKFQATKKWIVARTTDNIIHVYDCAYVTQIQKIKSFSFKGPEFSVGSSFFIHPTKPYAVSSSMILWEWDKGWQCTRKIGTGIMIQLAFNPEDPNSFACESYGHCVQLWSLDSSEPYCTLNGHSDTINSLDFLKHGDRLYLITGSDDCTVKIWDLQEKVCIHTLEAFMSPVLHVISLPGRPYLVTHSKNGTIHVWSSTDFRLKTTVNVSCGGDVKGLVCLMGSRRIAIGQSSGLYFMDIDDEEEEGSSEGNDQDSICATGQSSNP